MALNWPSAKSQNNLGAEAGEQKEAVVYENVYSCAHLTETQHVLVFFGLI